MDTGDPSYLGAHFLFLKNRTFPCPSPSANLVGIRGIQEYVLYSFFTFFQHLLYLGIGKQTYLNHPYSSINEIILRFFANCENHGHEPRSKMCGSCPPLCGIVQLTNSSALRFRNWSFTIM